MGPAQVAARIVELANQERHHPLWTLSISITLVAIGLILLALDIGFGASAILLFGIGNGLFAIARGSLPLAFYGEQRYPTIIGYLARPWLIVRSSAPILGIGLITRIGPQASLYVVASVSVLNILVALWLWKVSAHLR